MKERGLIVSLFLLLFLSFEVHAELLRVTNLSGSGQNSLRDRIENDAAGGDTVWVDVSGTVSIGSPININTPVTILGPMPTHLTIDAGSSRHFVVNHPNGVTKLRGVRLINGNSGASAGGSILIQDGTLRLRNALIEDSKAEADGGGIANMDTLYLRKTTFLNCSTQTGGDGGALYSKGGVWAQTCTFSQNHAVDNGGAFLNDSGLGRVRNSTIIHNSAGGDGGGIVHIAPDNAILTHSIVEYNDAGMSGPNMYTPSSDTIDSYGYNLIPDTSGANFDAGAGELLQGPETSGISDSSAIDTNGYGMRYYLLPDTSDAIDTGVLNGTLIKSDQRFAPRPIDGEKNGVNRRDIGAVEYTPYIVKSNGSIIGMTLRDAINDINSRSSPPYYVSFDLPSGATVLDHPSSLPYEVAQRVVIDGWSQPGSEVPGPNDPTQSGAQVSKGTPVVGVDGSVNLVSTGFLFKSGANKSVLRGISVIGHTYSGVEVRSDTMIIRGNHIGVSTPGDGSSGKENTDNGIVLTSGASMSFTGGVRHFQRNVFGMPEGRHISFNDDAGTWHRVMGNFFGITADGANPIAVGGGVIGIRIANEQTFVGSKRLAGKNIVSGNQDVGISITGVSYQAKKHRIAHNRIGTDYKGMNNIGNGGAGISAQYAGSNRYIGNLVSGNAGDGVVLGADTDSSILRNNTIGLASDDSTVISNGKDGVWVADSTRSHRIGENKLGGPSNLISGNSGNGIYLQGADHEVQGNYIGLKEQGLDTASNLANGIAVAYCDSCLIGGSRDSTGNVISGNDSSGIVKRDTGSLIVQGNYIGTSSDQGSSIPNGQHGVHIDHATSRSIIGATDSSRGNVIAGNDSDGVRIENGSSYTLGHLVGNNFIGIDDSSSETSLGNGMAGVRVNGDSNSIGSDLGYGNHIAYNQGAGIRMDSTRYGNHFFENQIHNNGGLGIDLGGDGVTVYDAGDGDDGPNDLMNHHTEILGLSSCGGQTTVRFVYNGRPYEEFRVEFYKVLGGNVDPSGYGEGDRFLAADSVFTSFGSLSPDTFTVSFTPAFNMAPSDSLTATMTNTGNHSTSEFGPNFAADSLSLQLDSIDSVSCAGDSDAVGYVSASGGIDPYEVTWYDSSASTVVDTSSTVDSLWPGTYQVVLVDDVGCEDTLEVVIPTADTLLVDAGSDTTICEGDTVQLGGSPTADKGTTPYDISWSDSASLDSDTIAAPNAFPIDTTTYKVVVTDAEGCKDSAQVLVEVNPSSTAPTGASATSDTICQGDSSDLNASGGSLGTMATYEWYSGSCGGTSVGSGTNVTVGPGTSTTYYVRIEGDCDTTSCQNVTVFVKDTSDAPSSASATQTSICPGDTTTLSQSGGVAGTGGSMEWYSGSCGGVSVGSGGTIDVAPTDTTTYYVRAEADCDTTVCQSVTIDVKDTSQAPVSVGVSPNDTICQGESVTLSQSGGSLGTGASYEWYKGGCGLVSVGTGGSITVLPATSDIYYVRAESSCDTTACASLSVVVQDSSQGPTGASASPDTICPGNSTTLTLSGGTLGTNATYEWYTGSCGGTAYATGDTVSASPSSTTTYYGRIEGDCDTTLCQSVTVELGDPDAEAGPNDTICVGDTLKIGGSPTSTASNVEYDWSPGSSLTDSTASNPSAFPSANTDYVVTVTDTITGCQAMDTVTVDTLPNLFANAGKDTAICSGDTVQIGGSPSASGGSGNYQYQWSPSSGLSSTTTSNPLAHPGSITTYYLTVTDGAASCKEKDSIGVTVQANPNLIMDGTDTLCQGDTGTVSAYSIGNLVDDWQWNTGDTIDTIQVAPSVDSTFVVTGLDSGTGCSTTDSVSVTVLPVPTVQISGNDTLCQGDSLILQASGASSYTWQDSSKGSEYEAVPDSSQLYWVEGSNTSSCSDTDSVAVSVFPSPGVPNSSLTTQGLCPKDSFEAFGIAPDTSYLAEWYAQPDPSSGKVAVGDTLTSIALSGDTTERYAFLRDTVSGCTGSPLEFLVVDYDGSSVSFPSDTSICVGEEVELNAAGASSYSWSPAEGLSDTNIASPTASPSSGTTYELVASFGNGCTLLDSVRVDVRSGGACSIKVYNAFTPNDDGQNEEWIIDGIRAYPSNRVTIYNRWGDRLIRFQGYDNEEKVWGGKRADGSELPSGTYFYEIVLKGDEKERITGYVQITK